MHGELLAKKKRNVVAESKGAKLRCHSNFLFFSERFLHQTLAATTNLWDLTGREWRHAWYDAEMKV
jgi:hypothetical protein